MTSDLVNDDDLEKSVVDWVIDCPGAAAVLDEHAIDYSCGGKSLGYACEQAGVDPAVILEKIRQKALDR